MPSGQAELYALVSGAAQTKGLMSLMADCGISTIGIVCTDATVATGTARRPGLGKTRHIDVQYLWFQQELS